MGNPRPVRFAALESFFRMDSNVVCAWLFGSAQHGWLAPGSDLDVAVLFKTPPQSAVPYMEYYLSLCNALSEVDAVDLVNLNTANTILAFEAVRGRVIRKNDPEQTASFVSLVCREYEDVMGNLERQRRLRTQVV